MKGHNLLINYLNENNLLYDNKKIVEIGTTREVNQGDSSLQFAKLTKKHDMFFITVDMNPENTISFKKIIKNE